YPCKSHKVSTDHHKIRLFWNETTGPCLFSFDTIPHSGSHPPLFCIDCRLMRSTLEPATKVEINNAVATIAPIVAAISCVHLSLVKSTPSVPTAKHDASLLMRPVTECALTKRCIPQH